MSPITPRISENTFKTNMILEMARRHTIYQISKNEQKISIKLSNTKSGKYSEV